MANVERLVPFILKWESGTTDKKLTGEQLFEKAKKKGYPVPTVERLKNISYKDWLAILKTMYWDRWKADLIQSQSLANLLVDWVWSSGKYGIIWPQSYLGVDADGIVGNQTLSALENACKDESSYEVFQDLVKRRIAYIDWIIKRDSRKKKFKNGWLNRLYDLKYEEK